MRINTYYFADGSCCEAETLEQAILIQKANGNSTKPIRMQKGQHRSR